MTAQKQVGFESTTPNGTVVYFQAEPKRLYRVCAPEDAPIAGNYRTVPSVTEVLGVLDKPALPWWGMRVGVEGVLELAANGHLGRIGQALAVRDDRQLTGVALATVDNVVLLLTQEKLTVNHVRDRAGDRGASVHRALEAWGEDHSLLPDPRFYPEEEQGYVEGLRKFLGDLKLGKGKVEMEIMVGSVEHLYAGRYDLQAPIEECELVVNTTPVRGETREPFAKGRWLFDLKTSAGFYPTQFIQLEAYEQASVECGWKPTVGRAVVRVDREGYYEVRRSKATFSDFAAIHGAWKALADLRGRK